MNVTFACPKCEATHRAEISTGTTTLRCINCGQDLQVPPGAVDDEGRIHRCLVCPSTDLFARKDFPQRLGVIIVTVGLLASCVAWGYSQLYLTFAILFATALVDVVLYIFLPNALMCYRCGAMYRGVADTDDHGSFNLETHERYRQQQIRMAEVKAVGAKVNSSGAKSSAMKSV